MSGVILTINAGSSSVKFALYEVGRGELLSESYWEPAGAGEGHNTAFRQIGRWLDGFTADKKLIAVGHRVVHGGERYAEAVRLDEEVLEELTKLIPLAPLHQPHNLAAIRAVAATDPQLPQVACFDTAFHRGHAPVSERVGLPYALYEQGVKRYGFHGLSYEYIAYRLDQLAPEIARGRVVVAHLGSGSSMCALRDGRSIESTMGFSALDGLPMGTRCGSLDPGVLLYLMQRDKLGVAELEELLYKRSGLIGISGVSNDMRTLKESDDPRARDAIYYFVYRIAQELGALTASLGGLD